MGGRMERAGGRASSRDGALHMGVIHRGQVTLGAAEVSVVTVHQALSCVVCLGECWRLRGACLNYCLESCQEEGLHALTCS